MRLERWVWTEFEIFIKVWKRACNGFSDILDRAGKAAEDGWFGSCSKIYSYIYFSINN